MALLGDASAPDPVCRKSPGRRVLDAVLERESQPQVDAPFVYRRFA
jgi:pyrroloquinoline quinone biosynthesis protein E